MKRQILLTFLKMYTMISKKCFVMILLIISCSIHLIAQTDYYYYKGKKIPLFVNDNKVCVSIPKNCEKSSEKILAGIRILSKIKDEDFDISVILRSEYEKLTSKKSWKEDAKSVILTPNYSTADKTEVFMTPYLNLRLKKGEDIDILTSYAEQYGLKIIKQDPFMPLWYILALTLNCNRNTLECANLLWESGKFSASVPDFYSNGLECSNDPLFHLQWGLHNSYNAGIDLSVCSAWDYATGKNVKIAILDSGIDVNHYDLASNISNVSYDTETSSSPSGIYGDHGTKCAGVAAAVKDNYYKIAGVAPDATIIPISNNMMDTTTNSLIKRADGIIWAYQNGADIISNSWTAGTYSGVIEDAIQNAFTYGRHGKGCVIVFAAGNKKNDSDSCSVKYPANCNDMILAVGAIDSTGTRATSSTYGTKLDLVAPGVCVFTTYPNNQTGFDNGTSMACPHVAGVAALVLERNSELTISQVNSIICSNAKKLQTVNFNENKPYGSWNNEYGYGLVDAYSSVINTPGTAYIQNDTITGTRIITGDNIYVGRDVTNIKPYGDVILGQGDITLKADFVEIKNSTTVPLGTTLKIEN